MGSYFSQLVHEAILSDGDSSLKLHGVKLSKKEASVYATKLVEQLGTKLHYLSIDKAKLKNVPSEICVGLTVLRRMQLVDNQLDDLPSAFSSLKNLVAVNLAQNEFAKIPQSLIQCTTLKRVDLSSNQLKGVPDNFGESLANLESLVLAGNRLDDSGTWPGLMRLSRLTSLDLSSNQLKHVPTGIFSLSRLREINLNRNELTSIEPLAHLTSLRRLELSHTLIDPSSFSSTAPSQNSDANGAAALSVVNVLTALRNLQTLDLSHNRIVTLSSELFTTLTKLTNLRLHSNKLLRVPKEIGCLTELTSLFLQENQLLKLDKSISLCASLTILRLEFNNLSKLPASMKSLSKLHCLMLHNNKFRIIPEPLYDAPFVSHLYTLSLEGNPLTPEILRHIAQKGTREYILERECKLREEEEAAGKRKGRPSLSRIASQYGSLRGGVVVPNVANVAQSKRAPALGAISSSGSNPGYGTMRRQSISTRFGASETSLIPATAVPASLAGLLEPPTSSTSPRLGNSSTESYSPTSSVLGSFNEPASTSGDPSSNLGSGSPRASTPTSPHSNLRAFNRSPSSSQLLPGGSRTFTRSKTTSSSTTPVAAPITSMGSDGQSSSTPLSPTVVRLKAGRAISDPSRVSGAPTSLAEVVKSEHNTDVPSFSRFKDAFESLLDQQDLSEARREELRKASVESKWELMRIYKGNLVHLLSNNTVRAEREKKFESWQKLDKKIERLTPQYFISSLKGQTISMSDMSTLKSMFESAPLPWVYEFIDAGGISQLARYIMHLFNDRAGHQKSAQDIVKETEAVSCMSVLSSASSSLVLAAPDAIFGVVLCLASDQLATIKPALKLLLQIHSEHEYASQVIMNALEQSMEVLKVPHRFSLLMNLLPDLPHLKQDYDVKADVLALLSKICDTQPLIERYLLRKELNRVGLEKALIDLNEAPHHALQQQLEIIDESTFADTEAIKTLAATDYRVLLRIQDEDSGSDSPAGHGGATASPASTLNANNLASSTVSGLNASSSQVPPPDPQQLSTIKIIVGDLGTSAVRVLPDTTIADLMRRVLQRYSIEHSSLYKLFFLSTNAAKLEGIWADDPGSLVVDIMSKFGGECIASFKMKPLNLKVDCPFAKKTVTTDLEPVWSVQQAIAHIVTSNGFSLDGDYQLSVLLDPKEADSLSTPRALSPSASAASAAAMSVTTSASAGSAGTNSSPISIDATTSDIDATTALAAAPAAGNDDLQALRTQSMPLILTTRSSTHLGSIIEEEDGDSPDVERRTHQRSVTSHKGETTQSHPPPTVAPLTIEFNSHISPRGSPRIAVLSTRDTHAPTMPFSSEVVGRAISPRKPLALSSSTVSLSDGASDSHSEPATTPRRSPSIEEMPQPASRDGSSSSVHRTSFQGQQSDSHHDTPKVLTPRERSDTVDTIGTNASDTGSNAAVEPSSPPSDPGTVDSPTSTSAIEENRSASPSPAPLANNNLEEGTEDKADDSPVELAPVPALSPVDMPLIPIPSLNQAPKSRELLPEFTLPSAPSRVVLNDADSMLHLKYSEFTLQDLVEGRVMLQLGLRPTKLKIFMGDEGLFMEVDVRWPIAELLRHIAKKVPEVHDTISDYGIMMETKQRKENKRRSVSKRTSVRMPSSQDTLRNSPQSISEWLSLSKSLLYYDFDQRKHTLRLALRPRELFVILPNGKEIALMVGFEESISTVIKLVMGHLDDDVGTNYSLFSGQTLMSRRKNLRDAGVRPGDHLVLRQEAESTNTNTDEQDVDIWEEPHTDNYTIFDANPNASTGATTPTSTQISSGAASSSASPSPSSGSGSTSVPHGGSSTAPSSGVIGAGMTAPSSTSSAPGSGGPAVRSSRRVYAISFNKMIERLTHPSDMDPELLEVFLLTYRSFTTPEQVLAKLMQRFNVPPTVEGHTISEKEADLIRVRVCVFLTQWLDRSFADIDELLMEKLNIWIENDVEEERRPLLFSALNKVRTRKAATPERQHPVPIELSGLSEKATLLDLDVAEIAKQLTLYSWEVLTLIKPVEFFDCAWSKPKLEHLAPNVLEMIHRFNYISNWCASEICRETKLRVRRTKFVKLVKVALVLREMGNFHMLYALISGWNNVSVSRLRWTIEKLPKPTKTAIAELEQLLSMEGSFKNYRDALKRISSATPHIPYIGIPLKDLTFIEDGNPNDVNGLINWYKRRLVHSVVSEYLRSSLVPPRILPVIVNGTHIGEIMRTLPNLDENTLHEASLKAEPRGAKPEQLL